METSKMIEILGASEHVGIIIPPNPSFDALVSAEVLAATLQEREKQVGFFSRPTLPKEFAPSFPILSAGKALPHEFIVSVGLERSPVSQLRYEKEDGRIDIILSPKHTSLTQDDVSFKEGRVRCDALVVLGIPDIEGSRIELSDPALLSETPIINIDVSEENKSYGDANLVDTDSPSLAEAVYKILTPIKQHPFTPPEATLLLAALVRTTENFSGGITKADTLLTASELVRLGGDLAWAQGAKKDFQEMSLVQLFGRASVRSRFDDEKRVLWSFLTPEDFEKTGRSASDLSAVVEKIGQEFPAHHVSALLWQGPEEPGVQVLLGGNRSVLEKIEARGAGTFQSPYLRLGAKFGSFREAEEIVNSLLGDVL